VATLQLQETDQWKTILNKLPTYARIRVESELPAGEHPPFADYVIGQIEADAASGQRTPRSATLLDSGLVLFAIADPRLLATSDAIRLALAAAKLDERLDAKLLMHHTRPERDWPQAVAETEIAHVLEILAAISDCRRLILPLMKFMKLPQKRLRSKVVKLIGRASQNSGWIDMLLSDTDPRVRANLVEGIGNQKGPAILEFLMRAAKDYHHRVSTTALLELSKRNVESAGAELHRLSVEGDEPYRNAAAWALRQLEQPAQPSEAADEKEEIEEAEPAKSA